MKEIAECTKEALSKPVTLKHQIAPRVSPFFYQMVKNYGKQVYFFLFFLLNKIFIYEPG